MNQDTKPCRTCNSAGHSHCPECRGSGKSDIHIITHPRCPKKCGGVMFPVGHQPGAPLKCGTCGYTP